MRRQIGNKRRRAIINPRIVEWQTWNLGGYELRLILLRDRLGVSQYIPLVDGRRCDRKRYSRCAERVLSVALLTGLMEIHRLSS